MAMMIDFFVYYTRWLRVIYTAEEKTSTADVIHGVFFSLSECINLSMIEKLDGLPII